MAKIEQGYMGGFVGKLGPAVGYHWRGKWCMRALPAKVHNPRTAAQQAHRMRFREMVQLAGRFRAAVNTGLHQLACEHGMTECNMFVRRNHRLLGAEGLDYSRLEVSHGPVAPVAFAPAEIDGQMVLRVAFEKNPLRQRADGDDRVVLFIYCVDHQMGIRTRAVERRSGRVEVALPSQWRGTELHIYGFVEDRAGRASRTLYISQAPPAGDRTDRQGEPKATELPEKQIIVQYETGVDKQHNPEDRDSQLPRADGGGGAGGPAAAAGGGGAGLFGR